MNKVFVDTWAWYAMADAADTDPTLAQLANEQLLAENYTFVTTNFVLAETITLIRYHLHHTTAEQFRDMIQQLIYAGLVELVRINEAHEATAWEIFKQYADQKFSYTDCTSFAMMRDLKFSHVFTADHHFAVLGFTLVP